MPERDLLRRPHPRLLVARTVSAVRSAWIVVGVGLALGAVLPNGWRSVLVVVGCYYAYTRFYRVFYDYVAIRYSGSTRGVLFVRGIVGREEKRFAWESIVTVAVTQNLLQRGLRLADVRLNLDASEMASETIPGVGVAEAARLVRLHAQHRRAVSTPSTVCPDLQSDPASVITPTLALQDFLFIGIYSGAFMFFVPSVYSIAAEARAAVGLPSAALPSISDLGSIGVTAASVCALVGTLLSLVYGTGISWIRYRRFGVELRPNGDLVFVAGLSNKERRVIAADAVAAFELRRPLLMAPVRRAFLRAVVRGDAGQVTRGMLLPMTRSSQGIGTLCRLTGLSRRALANRARSVKACISIWIAVGIAALVVGSIAVSSIGAALVVAAGAALVVRVVDARIGTVEVATAAAAKRWIVVDRGILFRSTWVISSGAVDVSRWSGLSRRYGSLTMSIRGRRATRLRVWPTSARLAAQLRRAIDSSTQISFERNLR